MEPRERDWWVLLLCIATAAAIAFWGAIALALAAR